MPRNDYEVQKSLDPRVYDSNSVASLFSGLSGRLVFGPATAENDTVILGYTWMDNPGDFRFTGTGCIQSIQRRAGNSLPTAQQMKTAITLFGSIWKSNSFINNSSLLDTCFIALKRAFDGDPSALTEIEGDYVCGVLTSTGVMLFKSLNANRDVYYRLDKIQQCVIWSTNYMDLVEDPVRDIDTSRLASFVWGSDVMVYPQIQSLEQGELVKISSNGPHSESYERHTATIRPDTYDFMLPKKRSSLSAYAKTIREVLLKACLERAAPFDKVGVLLSGGIDSAAIARCLTDGGVETVCYHVSSRSFRFVDEYEYAEAVCNKLDLPLRTIDVSEQRLHSGGYLNTSREFAVPHNHAHLAFWDAAVDVIDGEVPVVFSGLGGHLFSEPNPFSFWTAIRNSSFRDLPDTITNGLSVIANRQLRSARPGLTYQGIRLEAMRGSLSPDAGGDIFTEYAEHHITRFISESLTQITNDLHVTSINLNVLSPNGIIHLTPYIDREVDQLLQLIPKHEIAFQGRVYPKPLLNLAFVGLLPPRVISRQGNPSLVAMTQSYCSNNVDIISQILQSDSALVQLGILDHSRLLEVLSDRGKLHLNAPQIINACLVTLWFQSLFRRGRIML